MKDNSRGTDNWLSMLPHSHIMIKTTTSKDTAAQRAFLSARLASAGTLPWTLIHSPRAPHQRIQKSNDCSHCDSDSVASNSGRPRNINGPFWLTCASHRAVDPPTALSAVRLVLSDTGPSLANLYVDRINRMTFSPHVS